jgi:DNA-binding CsgD family transcriptional regulator
METPPSLSDSDARAIVRLLGEVASLDGDLVARKQCLMDGLCSLIGADSWAWATTCRFDPGKVPLSSGFQVGGFSPEQFAKFQEALEHPDTGLLNAAFTHEFEQKKTHLTRLRDQVDAERLFRQTAVYPIWLAAGIEEVILSIRPGREGLISQIGVYRRPGRTPFSPRESRITHIVLGEVPWLHEAVLSPSLGSTVARLSPRQRITLNLLLDGQDRPRIAEHLRLSRHTVDGYVKDVFRFFNVHSQAALVARFQRGDGGDLP